MNISNHKYKNLKMENKYKNNPNYLVDHYATCSGVLPTFALYITLPIRVHILHKTLSNEGRGWGV